MFAIAKDHMQMREQAFNWNNIRFTKWSSRINLSFELWKRQLTSLNSLERVRECDIRVSVDIHILVSDVYSSHSK